MNINLNNHPIPVTLGSDLDLIDETPREDAIQITAEWATASLKARKPVDALVWAHLHFYAINGHLFDEI